jgi:predicted aspartyl protease
MTRPNDNPVTHRALTREIPGDPTTAICSQTDSTTVSDWWDQHALQLADRRDYAPIDTMHWAYTPDGGAVYLVRADSHDGHYEVHVPANGHPICSCPAGEHGRPCKHAGIALRLWTTTDRPARQKG